MKKKLIVNADDYGISESVNTGIIEAVSRGIVTSTSVMINMVDDKSTIELLKKSVPHVSVGIHINLTKGKPVSGSEVPSLIVGNGYFNHSNGTNPFTVNYKEVRSEIKAQFEKFIDYAGDIPSHIDSHEFMIHMIPSAFESVLEYAKMFGIPVRIPEAFLDHEKTSDFFDFFEIIQQKEVSRYLVRINRRNLFKYGSPLKVDLFEYGFYGAKADIVNLECILRKISVGTTEIMCHPGYICDLKDPYRNDRIKELEILTSDRIKRIVDEEKISLISYKEFKESK
jgi:chitin disaccharide deacetylase